MARFLRWIAGGIALLLCLAAASSALAQPLEEGAPMTLTAPSALLMEAETGAVIFEKNAGERRPVASVTKLMTLLLVLERLDAGSVTLEGRRAPRRCWTPTPCIP